MQSEISNLLRSFGLAPGQALGILASILLTYVVVLPELAAFVEVRGIAERSIQISLLAAIAIGYTLWLIYLKFLGEYLIFPTSQALHWVFDTAARLALNRPARSAFGYLREFQVPISQMRRAYRILENDYFSEAQAQRTSLAHGENQVFIIVAMFLSTGLFLNWSATGDWFNGHALIFNIALVLFGASFTVDWIQQAREVDALRHAKEWKRAADTDPASYLEDHGIAIGDKEGVKASPRPRRPLYFMLIAWFAYALANLFVAALLAFILYRTAVQAGIMLLPRE